MQIHFNIILSSAPKSSKWYLKFCDQYFIFLVCANTHFEISVPRCLLYRIKYLAAHTYTHMYIYFNQSVVSLWTKMNSQSKTNKMATFYNLFISVRRCTCFRRFFRPLLGAQNCTYSVRYLSDRYCYMLLAAGSGIGLTNTWRLYVQFWAPDDGRKPRLRHVERLTEINTVIPRLTSDSANEFLA